MILLRRPLLFLLVLAVGASLTGSGRLSLRLLLDTSVVLAIIPVIQIAAFALVFWTGRRRHGFAHAVDAFFAGSGPWFAVVAVMAALGAVTSPVMAAQWFPRVGAVAGIAAIVLSLRLDFLCFTRVLGRTPQRATVDLIVHRGIGWTVTVLYFTFNSSPKMGMMIPNVAAALLGARS